MGRWLIVREDQVRVFYVNLQTQVHWPLGELSLKVPDEEVVAWVFSHGEPALGDEIRMSDGTRVFVQQQKQVRALA
jgi:hypothetical protein